MGASSSEAAAMQDLQHVYPVDEEGLEHNTEGLWCWCRPWYGRLCRRCGGREGGCRACRGTGFTITRPGDPDLALVLHRRAGSAGLAEPPLGPEA
jgi:hypothetical protein